MSKRVSTWRSRATSRARAPACRDWVALALQIHGPGENEAVTHYIEDLGDLEDLVHDLQRGGVPVAGDRTHVLVLDLCAALFELGHEQLFR